MHLFYQLILLIAIFLVNVIFYRLFNSIDTDLKNHTRIKRVYNGDEVENDKFPYMVFLRTIFNKNDHEKLTCHEKTCTGTLIHRRYVLTLLECCYNDEQTSETKIFLKTRPYEEIKNMTYNVGILIEKKPSIGWDIFDSDNIAIILMNDTFPEVTTFPKILQLTPIPDGTTLSCSTVGFSLIGRKLPRPIDNSIKPMSYDFEARLNLTKCVVKEPIRKKNTYLCYSGSDPLKKTLCDGDMGSPLLCKNHLGGDDIYVYGLAEQVSSKCDGTDRTDEVMFLYMLKYGKWISYVLDDFDEKEIEANMTTAMSTDGVASTGTLFTVGRETPTTELPEEYDTSYYDSMKKKPVRCKTACMYAAAAAAAAASDHRSGIVALGYVTAAAAVAAAVAALVFGRDCCVSSGIL